MNTTLAVLRTVILSFTIYNFIKIKKDLIIYLAVSFDGCHSQSSASILPSIIMHVRLHHIHEPAPDF